jgi:hypothetical protein
VLVHKIAGAMAARGYVMYTGCDGESANMV